MYNISFRLPQARWASARSVWLTRSSAKPAPPARFGAYANRLSTWSCDHSRFIFRRHFPLLGLG
ncbi:hypothetical protein FRC12_000691, partial [Ceratobasidium sp. 428]